MKCVMIPRRILPLTTFNHVATIRRFANVSRQTTSLHAQNIPTSAAKSTDFGIKQVAELQIDLKVSISGILVGRTLIDILCRNSFKRKSINLQTQNKHPHLLVEHLLQRFLQTLFMKSNCIFQKMLKQGMLSSPTFQISKSSSHQQQLGNTISSLNFLEERIILIT